LALLLLDEMKLHSLYVARFSMKTTLLRNKGFFAFFMFFLWGMASPPPSIMEMPQVDLEVFVRKGCPHCESAKRFLRALQQDHPGLQIIYHDVGENSEALDRFIHLASKFDVKQAGVPAFWLKGKLIVGFSEETTGRQLESLLGRPPPQKPQGKNDGVCGLEDLEACGPSKKEPHPSTVHFPLLGPQTFSDLGLPIFTLLLGLLDGFNPCAMWVLLFLLSLLASLRDRTKMVWLAGTFVIMSGVVYFGFMVAWLNLFFLIGYTRVTQLVLGSLAGVVGFINIKDFFAFKRGVTVSIPESVKPGLYEKMRHILQANSFPVALAGMVGLALMVNVFELACTAGFPALYTQILSQQVLDGWTYYGYLGLYNLAYIADDAVMVSLAVVTLRHRKLQEREGRWLKFISGVVMLGLAGLLIGAPEWLF
jgi:glutaredoxin